MNRIRPLNDRPPRSDGAFVLYWMVAARRTGWNFGLQRAVSLAREHRKPLFVLEPLRCGYRWASDRHHAFVVAGMADNARRFREAGVTYHPYVEPEAGAGRGLLETLAERACAVVTDDFPAFFLPRMLRAAGARLDVTLEAVDSNGIVPLGAADRVYPTAHGFRRFLQKVLREHLDAAPDPDPLAGVALEPLAALPREVTSRWPTADLERPDLGRLPIDHSVAPVSIPGGEKAGRAALERFLDERLEHYADRRNDPAAETTSGLSPYLHFGHLASHEILHALLRREGWFPGNLGDRPTGAREGWWGLSRPAEAFVDQLVTWREVGFNMAARAENHERYESLPPWALATLAEHASDPRAHVYDLAAFEQARTHDPLWNAAQIQLVREGRMHNYLRMLWGKKILEWSPSPEQALDVMVELNNKYALDGRDPNSYSGIFWCLGRYDRPWGPERPIFGKVRYMSSKNTERKLGRAARTYRERYDASALDFG